MTNKELHSQKIEEAEKDFTARTEEMIKRYESTKDYYEANMKAINHSLELPDPFKTPYWKHLFSFLDYAFIFSILIMITFKLFDINDSNLFSFSVCIIANVFLTPLVFVKLKSLNKLLKEKEAK